MPFLERARAAFISKQRTERFAARIRPSFIRKRKWQRRRWTFGRASAVQRASVRARRACAVCGRRRRVGRRRTCVCARACARGLVPVVPQVLLLLQMLLMLHMQLLMLLCETVLRPATVARCCVVADGVSTVRAWRARARFAVSM